MKIIISSFKYTLQYFVYFFLTKLRFNIYYVQKAKKIKTQTCVLLTSYPPRFQILTQVVQNLLSQSETVNIYITIFEKDMELFNVVCKKIIMYPNVKIEIVKYDIRSYKKIAHLGNILHEYKYFLICDDDVYYPRNFVKKLLVAMKKNKVSVTCGLAHHFVREGKHLNWTKYINGKFSGNTIMNGVAGILLSLDAAKQLNKLSNNDYKRICPNNDDLWISLYLLKGFNKFCINRGQYFNWIYNDPGALYQTNSRGRLEKELKNLLNYV
jgi:hypothetical protein